MESHDAPPLHGFSHVSLSVADIVVSAAFYEDLFGFSVIDRVDEADFVEWILEHPSEMLLCLQQHRSHSVGAFDPTTVGLDHLAFAVSTREQLDNWARRLDARNVAYTPIVDMQSYGAVLCLRDPDDIQLELHWRQT